MELFLILLPIFLYLIVKMALENRAAARADNVRLLEEALKSPTVDRATLESLTYQLTGHRPPHRHGTSRWLAFVLAIGWIALFVGVSLWVAGAYAGVSYGKDMVIGGIITAVAGFGVVTYPFALRELEARRQPQ